MRINVPTAAALWLLLAGPAWCQQNPNGQLDVTGFPQPFLLLVRDPYVHDKLQLSGQQRQQLRSACDELDPQFWQLRGQGPDQAAATLREMTASMEKTVAQVLDERQRRRLAQIQMQVAGMRVFQRDEVVRTLRLTESQQSSIDLALKDFQEGYQALVKRARDGEDSAKLDAEATALRSKLRSSIAETLTDVQKRAWQLMVGDRIDASKLGRVKFRAPSLDGQEPWVNSEPLGDQDLRGRVVALHFWAFRCINCQRNQPWYKDWHGAYADRGLVVVGVHTPELSSEEDVEALRLNANKNGLDYPILVDNQKRHWKGWGNTMWPTTYLIDKEGYVRYWWYGELNWKEAGAQRVFKDRIAELLAEQSRVASP